jgi:hypothetical protein
MPLGIVVGIERIDAHLELLAVAGSVISSEDKLQDSVGIKPPKLTD